MKTLITTSLIIILLFTGCLVKKANDNSPENAYYISQVFVKDNMLTPSTAVFPSYRKVKVSKSSSCQKCYNVSAYLDAQNAFGATIRIKYNCIVQYKYGSTWSLISMDVE